MLHKLIVKISSFDPFMEQEIVVKFNDLWRHRKQDKKLVRDR